MQKYVVNFLALSPWLKWYKPSLKSTTNLSPSVLAYCYQRENNEGIKASTGLAPVNRPPFRKIALTGEQ